MNDAINTLAELLLTSQCTVVLTGAGISTESGIPDFRSPESGIYSTYSENVFSTVQFRDNPAIFYSFAKEWLEKFASCKPNDAHTILAWLEQKRLVHQVVTQNIDSLHKKAGSTNVLEIHGHMRNVFCTECTQQYEFCIAEQQLFQESAEFPICPECRGVLKPTVVFFGDILPPDFQTAFETASKADLFLVLGSSLLVAPASMLPETAPGDLAIINLSSTPLDKKAAIVINQPLGSTMQLLKKTLQEKLKTMSSPRTAPG